MLTLAVTMNVIVTSSGCKQNLINVVFVFYIRKISHDFPHSYRLQLAIMLLELVYNMSTVSTHVTHPQATHVDAQTKSHIVRPFTTFKFQRNCCGYVRISQHMQLNMQIRIHAAIIVLYAYSYIASQLSIHTRPYICICLSMQATIQLR